MNSGTELFNDRKSPSSNVDPMSGSNSPHIIKPSVMPGGILHNRPRSSSINSNGSNHSNHTRSLSIASLESPRNSIVSIDDGFMKSSTRNNSTTSLNSLAMAPVSAVNPSTPKHNTNNQTYFRERFLFNNAKLKANVLNSSVLFSDDDDEPKIFKPKLHIRSRSNSNSGGPGSSNLNLNFNSPGLSNLPTYSSTGASSSSSSAAAASSSSMKKPDKPLKKDFRFKFNEILKNKAIYDNTKSPSADVLPSPLSLTANDNLSKSTIEQNRENFKKVSNVSQPINKLKKNLIFSKDVRMELLSNNQMDVNSKFPKKNQDEDDETKKLPILSALKQQNQLLSKLNKKWNKTEKLQNFNNDVNNNDPNDQLTSIKKRIKRRYSSDNDTDTD